MNLNLIGNENLPNIYFESIEIDSTSKGFTKQGLEITVFMKLYDGLNQAGSPYYQRHKKDPKKNIILFVCTNPEMAEHIRSGNLQKFNIKTLQRLISKYKSGFFVTPPSGAKTILNKTKEKERIIKTKINLNSDIDHLTFFAAIVLENDSYVENGPVFSERVIVNGQVMKKGFYLVNNRNTQYLGPVHMHVNKGLMEGSFHSSKSHGTLKRIDTINTKIKDNREVNVLKPIEDNKIYKQDKKELKNYHFTNINTSQNRLYGLNFTFGIDTYQILQDYIKDKKLSLINQNMFYKIASKTTIRSIDITYNTPSNIKFKHMASSKQLGQLVKTVYYYDKDGKRNTSPSRSSIDGDVFSILEELVLHEESRYRNFNCQVNSKKVKQIKVKITLRNPFIDYFKKLKEKMELATKNLKVYLLLLEKSKYHNRNTNRIKDEFVQDYYSRTDMWLNPLKTYAEVFKISSKKTNEQFTKMIEKHFYSLNPKTATKQSIENTIRAINKEFHRFYKNHKISKFSNFGKQKTRSRNNQNIAEVEIEKIYNVNYKVNPRTISVIDNKDLDKQIPIYTVTQISNMINAENHKYSIDMNNIAEQDVFYISPKEVKYKQSKMKINNLEIIDENQLKDFAISSNKNFDLNFGSNNLLITKYIKRSQTLISPTNLVGEDSSFNLNLDIVDVKIENQKPKNYDKISNFDQVPPDLEQYVAIPPGVELPIQIKDLVFKNSVFGLEKPHFIKHQPYKKDLLYDNLYKIYAPTDYDQDKVNRTILNSDNYESLNNNKLRYLDKPIVCSFVKEKIPLFQDGKQEFNNFSLLDSIFIIAPDNWKFTKVVESVQEEFHELNMLYNEIKKYKNFNTAGLRTNIVLQRQERQPVVPKTRSQDSQREQKREDYAKRRADLYEKQQRQEQKEQQRQDQKEQQRQEQKKQQRQEQKEQQRQEQKEQKEQKRRERSQRQSRGDASVTNTRNTNRGRGRRDY
jgi:hypothetical protein